MEVKDKVVTAEGLKGAYDNLNGKITQLNSDLTTVNEEIDYYISNHRIIGFTVNNVGSDTQVSSSISWTLSEGEKKAINYNYEPIAIPLTCNYGSVSQCNITTSSTTGAISFSVLNHSSASHTMLGSFLIIFLKKN